MIIVLKHTTMKSMASFKRAYLYLFFFLLTKTLVAFANEGVNPVISLVPQIQALERLLKEYQKKLKRPCLQWSCTRHPFKKGDSDPVLRTVKKQLQDPSLSRSFEFDHELEEAIIHFQKQHFLKPDGVIGQATCRALNMTVADRIRKIKLNLKRWEKLSPLLTGRYILVNI